MAEGLIFVGLSGRVVALERVSGTVVWTTKLPGCGWQFVSVASDVEGVFAAAYGEIWRLDPQTGDVLWHNKLPGMGMGNMSLALQRGDPYDLATSIAAGATTTAAQHQGSH